MKITEGEVKIFEGNDVVMLQAERHAINELLRFPGSFPKGLSKALGIRRAKIEKRLYELSGFAA